METISRSIQWGRNGNQSDLHDFTQGPGFKGSIRGEEMALQSLVKLSHIINMEIRIAARTPPIRPIFVTWMVGYLIYPFVYFV